VELKIVRKRVEILPDHDENDEVRFCPNCEGVLGSKILMPNEKKTRDHDLWLQCTKCYLIIEKYKTKVQSRVKDAIDVTDTDPHNDKTIVGLENRTSKLTPSQKERKKQLEHAYTASQEPDVQEALKHGLTVNLISDSNPEFSKEIDSTKGSNRKLRRDLYDAVQELDSY